MTVNTRQAIRVRVLGGMPDERFTPEAVAALNGQVVQIAHSADPHRGGWGSATVRSPYFDHVSDGRQALFLTIDVPPDAQDVFRAHNYTAGIGYTHEPRYEQAHGVPPITLAAIYPDPATAACGAINPDYPDDYICTYPPGHPPIEQGGAWFEHAAPRVGAYWNPTIPPVEDFRDFVLARADEITVRLPGWLGRMTVNPPIDADADPRWSVALMLNATDWPELLNAYEKATVTGQHRQYVDSPEQAWTLAVTLYRALDLAADDVKACRGRTTDLLRTALEQGRSAGQQELDAGRADGQVTDLCPPPGE
jgi:hypothetical protein